MALLVGPGVGGLVEVGLLTMAMADVHNSSMWPSWKEAMRAAMVDWMLSPSLLLEEVGCRRRSSRWRKSHQKGVGSHEGPCEAWAREMARRRPAWMEVKAAALRCLRKWSQVWRKFGGWTAWREVIKSKAVDHEEEARSGWSPV